MHVWVCFLNISVFLLIDLINYVVQEFGRIEEQSMLSLKENTKY